MAQMKLSDELIEECKQAFSLFDKDGDGTITSAEIKAVMLSLGQKATDDEIDDMLREVDGDGDGTIDFDEFLIMMNCQVQCDNPEDELVAAFKTFDKDRNGFIDAKELKETMTSLGERITMNDAKEMIAEADKNGDGGINFEEFVQMMSAMNQG